MEPDSPTKSAYAMSLTAPTIRTFPIQLTLRPRNVPDVPADIDFLMEHLNDPNFDLDRRSSTLVADLGDSIEMKTSPSVSDAESQTATTTQPTDTEAGTPTTAAATTGPPEDDSLYAEVRGSVSSFDDPTVPINTFRMWTLGLFYTVLVAALNQVFSMRYPSIAITGIVAQLTALPLGKVMEYVLPTTRFRMFGYTFSLNPGAFNVKEHVCITVMTNVVAGGAYATEVLATQHIFYGQQFGFTYSILLVISTQLIGFSFGGILRRFVVWPACMIWPGALVNSQLFNALHRTFGLRERGHMTRERFFCIILACSFVWYFVPGYLFTGLSMFNWACWIAPSNVIVNTFFGTSTGLGMSILTFDWSMVSFIGSPLVVPWWAELNTIASFIIHFWWITPIIFFTNTLFTKHLPISTYYSADRFGGLYDGSLIVTDGIFDLEKYMNYSPVFLSASIIVAYGAAFASFSAVIVHTWLWYGNDIARRFRTAIQGDNDVHSRLMGAYAEVPSSWYASVGTISLAFLLLAVSVFPTQLPIWAALFALVLAAVLCIPLAMLQAVTNQTIALQVMHEMICGYILPGRPIANMIFKCIAYIGTNQAVGFAGDLKLGHYMKIAPRMMFSVQVTAAVVSAFVVTFVQNWMFNHVENICAPDQVSGFVCPSTATFGNSSVIWGGIGPGRLFNPGAPYSALLIFFGIGAILPVPFYYLARKFPLGPWRYVSFPVFFAGIGSLPPASGINYAAWGVAGFIFQYFMRRFHFRWWMRYNYILSAALDAGVALAVIIIFFCIQYPTGGVSLSWWGNTVWTNTSDALGAPAIVLASGDTFGPESWS